MRDVSTPGARTPRLRKPPSAVAGPREAGAAAVSSPRGGEAKRVYDGLKKSILSLQLAPGESVDDALIASTYGVSRTPIREALVRLESEGLVVMLPNRGAHIAPLDLQRIKDYLEGMDLVQRAVMQWAAVRCSERQLPPIREALLRFEEAVSRHNNDEMVLANHAFHSAIAAVCGNALIADTYHRFLDEGLRISRFTLNARYFASDAEYQAFLDSVVAEHRDMLTALSSHDVDRAQRVADSHTAHTRERFVAYLRSSLSPLVPVSPLPSTMPEIG